MNQTEQNGLKQLGSRIPSLDGWRAVSIIMVLGGHCKVVHGFPEYLKHSWLWFFAGDLGVRFFFTISGLLITWLLLQEEQKTGGINLTNFYIRRAIRILPVYFAFLGVLFLLQLTTPFHQSNIIWASDLTFTANFCQQIQNEKAWTAGHLWSLSTEEQFYLIWPGMLILLGLTRNWQRGLRIVAACMVIAPIFRVVAEGQFYPRQLAWAFGLFAFPRYFDALAIGCGGALLMAHRWASIRQWLSRFPAWLPTLVGALLIALPYIATHKKIYPVVSIPLGHSLEGIGFALLLLQSVITPGAFPFRCLNWGWMCRLGVLSYSIYIWQMIFCTNPAVFGLGQVWWMGFPGWLLSSMAAALLSFYGLERPLLKLRERFRAHDPKKSPRNPPPTVPKPDKLVSAET
ncbi:MAG: acyltransferase [Verrucomicrobia bacterium]|nr:acyltransferase [Verrucomicrobiota bacterium]